MNTYINKALTSILATVFVLLLTVPAWGEVSLKGNGSAIFVDGDSGSIWKPQRSGIDSNLLLNPLGDLRGDQFGDWSTNPATGLAEVVWSRNTYGQFEIVFSWFEDGAWQEPINISRSIGNDLTPKLDHDLNGSRYVLSGLPTGETRPQLGSPHRRLDLLILVRLWK